MNEKFRYRHNVGYGELARGESLDPDMALLDLAPDTEVELIAFDDVTDWPIVEWEDQARNRRITTIDPDVFDTWFTKVEVEP